MKVVALALAGLSLALPLAVRGTSYSLSTTYQGSNFFNQWNFSTAIDVNYGNVAFQSYEAATSQQLAYINSAGNAIIKIDNTTVGNPNDETFGRASVYMTSNASVPVGSLVLFDALHAPYGCSVWPAFFMEGAGVTWPQKGEIDIFENVNQATVNQYSLHTLQGCTHPNTSGVISSETGTIISTDCYNVTAGNEGCIVRENKPGSFGSAFNSAGGGAIATLFDTNGVKQWFFPRNSIPSDFNTSSPDPSGWGTPSAFFSSSSCSMDTFFGPQTLILDIDICGSFAGDGGAFAATCQGSCLDLVRTPTNYDDAYFEIQYIKVFSETNGTSTSTSTSTASGSSHTATKGAALMAASPLNFGNILLALSAVLVATASAPLWAV